MNNIIKTGAMLLVAFFVSLIIVAISPGTTRAFTLTGLVGEGRLNNIDPLSEDANLTGEFAQTIRDSFIGYFYNNSIINASGERVCNPNVDGNGNGDWRCANALSMMNVMGWRADHLGNSIDLDCIEIRYTGRMWGHEAIMQTNGTYNPDSVRRRGGNPVEVDARVFSFVNECTGAQTVRNGGAQPEMCLGRTRDKFQNQLQHPQNPSHGINVGEVAMGCSTAWQQIVR